MQDENSEIPLFSKNDFDDMKEYLQLKRMFGRVKKIFSPKQSYQFYAQLLILGYYVQMSNTKNYKIPSMLLAIHSQLTRDYEYRKLQKVKLSIGSSSSVPFVSSTSCAWITSKERSITNPLGVKNQINLFDYLLENIDYSEMIEKKRMEYFELKGVKDEDLIPSLNREIKLYRLFTYCNNKIGSIKKEFK